MKRFFSTFWIVVLTCSLGIFATFLWLRFYPHVDSYETTDFARVPIIEYCDLRENPQRYDGKIIRLKTTLYQFMPHGYYLADENCSEDGTQVQTAISFFPANSSAIQTSLNKFREPYQPFGPVYLVAVGKFNNKGALGNSDAIADRTNMQFEIHTIEFASR